MTKENFTDWLHGFFELTDAEELTKDQVKSIKEHLRLVYTKVTASSIKISPPPNPLPKDRCRVDNYDKPQSNREG